MFLFSSRYIHSLQLVHMDIKPANIFVSREQKVNLQGEESADDGFEEEQVEEEEEVTYKIGKCLYELIRISNCQNYAVGCVPFFLQPLILTCFSSFR